MVSRKSFYTVLIIIACIFCNLSQMPNLMESRIISLIYTVFWLNTAVFLFSNNGRLPWRYLVFPVIFDFICVIGRICGMSYLSSDLFRPINLSTFILVIGIWAGRYLDYDSLKSISAAYILSSLAVAIYIYLNIFRGVEWSSSGYLYGSKNSAGQIFLVALILIAAQFLQKNKIMSFLIMCFFTALILMMKSRASIITLLIAVTYCVLFVLKKPSHKIIGIILIVTVFIVVLKNENLYNFVIKEIMLNNKDLNDVTAVTSNRDLHVEYFKQNFWDYWLVGTGGTYLESMPLAVLMSYGILGGTPVLCFSLQPLCVGIRNVKDSRYKLFCKLIIVLSIIMWVNGIFEEQSPFGPGVKCYFLWLVTGLFIGYRDKKKELSCYEKGISTH